MIRIMLCRRLTSAVSRPRNRFHTNPMYAAELISPTHSTAAPNLLRAMNPASPISASAAAR